MYKNYIRKLNIYVKNKFPLFGITGSLFILIAIVVTQFAFKNLEGGKYSMGNHFISELGWVGVSKHALIFNINLIIAGILFIVFIYGLTLQFNGIWGKLTTVFGLTSSLGCTLVGIYPLQTGVIPIKLHLLAAMFFFTNALLAILTSTFMVLSQKHKIVSKLSCILNLLILSLFASLLTVDFNNDVLRYIDFKNMKIINRPPQWNVPIIEWTIVLSIITYILLSSFYFIFRQRNIKNIK